MRMMNRRQFLKSAGAGLLAAGSLDRLARLASAQQETIPIGVVYPLTGSLARDAGLPRLRGARLRLVWADSKGDPATGRAEAERLIEGERVAAVIGSYQSAVTATASLAAEAKGIPFLNPESSSPRLTDRNFAWFFRTGPHDITFTKLFYDMMDDLKQRGRAISRVAILSEDTEFGATATGV